MITAMENHLWQSTLFAVVAWLLTLGLRAHRARVRHAVWLAASAKFLLPFSLLVALGARVEWRRAPVAIAPSNYAVVMNQVSEPFALAPPPAAIPRRQIPWEQIALAIWACGVAGIAISWLIRWSRIRAAVKAGARIDLNLPIRAVASKTAIEPGVFGIWRPVLMLPEGIFERLTESQLSAVIEHELAHVRHRDNLVAAIQMAIETMFWFHPLVWWMGKQMIAERERACDEAVLDAGGERQVYAEAILSVCKLYVESPLECVAGVTGAGLKDRIQAIVAGRVGRELGAAGRAMLMAAAAMSVIAPVAIGVWNAPALRAQESEVKNVPKWEAVSIKPCDSNAPTGRSGNSTARGPGRLNIPCQTPLRLIDQAFVQYADGRRISFERNAIEGAPAWASSERYTVAAKAETPESRTMMQGPMMQKLLEERFKLKIRRETREIAVYNLISGRNTKYLTAAKAGGCMELNFDKQGPPPAESDKLCEMIGRGIDPQKTAGHFEGYGFTMARFAEQLGALLDRPVIDKTGLGGKYDFQVPVPIEDLTPPKNDDPRRAFNDDEMIRAGVRQMGLRLEAAKGPGVVYVIESMERPTDNFTPQAEQKPVPQFEVASIKPCGNDPARAIAGGGVTAPGYINTGCVPLAWADYTGLIQRSYVRYADARYHPLGQMIAIEGGPEWVRREFFQIEAKAGAHETPEMMMGPMMQKLLEERFKLKVHRETREGAVYNLTVAKSKLRPVQDGSCTNLPVPGMPDIALKQGAHFCKFQIGRGEAPSIDAEGSTIGEFVTLLKLAVDRQVIDKTGLAGRFDIHLDFAAMQRGAGEPTSDRPSIFTAVREQLGLKLEPARGPNEFLVIDHVEKPTEN